MTDSDGLSPPPIREALHRGTLHPFAHSSPHPRRFLPEFHDSIPGTRLAFPTGSTTPGTRMPTILFLNGWRFFFYAEEGNEPIHVHCKKGAADAKYWLIPETFEISEARSKGMSPTDKRLVRKIIFEHFDYFVTEWNMFQERRNG